MRQITLSVWSTQWLHQLASDVPFVACFINLPSTLSYYLDLANCLPESALWYLKVLCICLCFVSAITCHSFD